MNTVEFVQLVQHIVKRAKELKNKLTSAKYAPVNYACIFAQTDEEYAALHATAKTLGKIVKGTPSGDVFQLPIIKTVSGDLQIVKVRKPDVTRQERGDADFTVDNYEDFKKRFLGSPGFKLITRTDMEMIEVMASGFEVRAYFSNPTLEHVLGITKPE